MSGSVRIAGTTWSCDPSATSSAVLFRSWIGASASVHRQSGQCTRWRASCAFLCCAQRQVPTVLSFHPGAGCCSTLTRSSMSWGRGCSLEACERISHIFYVLLALFAWNQDRISSSPLFLAATCPCALRQSTDAYLAVHTWKFEKEEEEQQQQYIATRQLWSASRICCTSAPTHILCTAFL